MSSNENSEMDVIYNLNIIEPMKLRLNKLQKCIHLGYVAFAEFFVHLVPFKKEVSYGFLQLKAMIKTMGEENKFQPLNRKPICGQVIVAKHNDNYHRALVIKTCDIWSEVIVSFSILIKYLKINYIMLFVYLF